MNEGKKNAYRCSVCKFVIVTVDLVDGVTPFMIDCKRNKLCNGYMQSMFYKVEQDLEPSYEWYKPSNAEFIKLDKYTQEHVTKGRLLLRPVAQGDRTIVRE